LSKTEFIPSFSQAKPTKLTEKPWLSSEEPQVLLFQGMRGSGKGVSVAPIPPNSIAIVSIGIKNLFTIIE
jgi:hypothetical protein